MRSRHSIRAAAAALAIAAVAGCTVARPAVTSTSVRISEPGSDVSRVAIELELENRGTDEIQLVEYDYVLTLADGARYSGKWAALRALPPTRSVKAEIPAILPSESLADGAASWSLRGTLRYRDPQSIARILYEAGFLKSEVDFAGEGERFVVPATTR